MRDLACAAVAVLVACGGGGKRSSDELTTPEGPHAPSCFEVLDHLDGVLGAAFAHGAGTPVFSAGRPMTHDDMATDCENLSTWVRVCVVLSATPGEITECAPEAEPTLLSYAGPSAYQKARFEECVVAARDRAELSGCSYYRPGPGRVPMYPADR